jgi:hypothetical protein
MNKIHFLLNQLKFPNFYSHSNWKLPLLMANYLPLKYCCFNSLATVATCDRSSCFLLYFYASFSLFWWFSNCFVRSLMLLLLNVECFCWAKSKSKNSNSRSVATLLSNVKQIKLYFFVRYEWETRVILLIISR